MQKLPVYNIQSFEFYSNAFYANNLASHIKEHGFIERPHRHDFYLTMLFTNGTGTHEIDFESYPVKKGAVFFLNPGQVHLWNLSDDSDGYIFFHTKEFYDIIYVNRQLQDFPFFATSQAAPYMVLEGEEMETAKDIFIRILKRYSSPPSAYKFETLATLCDLLYLSLAAQYFTASDVPHKSPLYVKRFYEFLKLVEERFKNLKYPGQYAD
ncbi:MAG TPA: AraC family ligand binding domain-containing protein, partial [Bacteroidia bacterium]|nr:AraC family ligand binding domain-containing protein [Bacteroidia bacterium]